MQTIAIGSGAGPLEGQAGLTTITKDEVGATDSLGVPAARAFDGLRVAYEAIGIPVTLSDPGAGRVGNAKLVMRQRLMRTPLSRYLRCGETLTGSRADSDRIVMAIVSTVTARRGGSSSVRTTLDARAIDT